MDLSNFNEVINFAIEKEEEAIDFYERLSENAKNPAMKSVFFDWSNEERKHKKMLHDLEVTGTESVKIKEIPNLKISDYMVETEESPDMDYADALVLAMKREEKSYNLYSDLEAKCSDTSLQKVFSLLKNEELKHKNRLESEYDENVLREN